MCPTRSRNNVLAPYGDRDKRIRCKMRCVHGHHNSPGKEPIKQHEFAARPWAKVGADLCDMQGQTLLVVSENCSNFIEVHNIGRANTTDIYKALGNVFKTQGA